MSDTNETAPAVVTYGGVQDRPNDVNHPDNLAAAANSTDPAATHAVPEGFSYDSDTDSYVRND